MDSSQHGDNVDGHKLLVMLRQTHDAVLKIRQIELRKFNLTPEQSAALMNIRALGKDATVTELSRRVFRKSNSTTVLVMRLEKRGLVRKTRDKIRRNTIRLTLTAKGHRCLQKAVQEDSFNEIIDGFEIEKRIQLGMLLEQLRNHALNYLHLDVKTYSDLFTRL